tara:strand:+ start:744 stop:1565 length:822 start_codon:yes stop_codon:yes gene_type:complete
MLTFILILFIFAIGFCLYFFFSRYQKCPSDRILVVYGQTSGDQSSKCMHGGATFIWPVIQRFEYLDLTPIPIDIFLEGALDKEENRVNVPCTFTVGISTDPSIMANAAERLLGLQLTQIRDLAKDIIFGQMRVVIADMSLESLISNRAQLIEKISQGIELELNKVGLGIINVNIQDIWDGTNQTTAIAKSKLDKKPAMIWDSNQRKERILKTLGSAKTKGCTKTHYIGSSLNIWDMSGRPISNARVILSLDSGEIISGLNKSDQEGLLKIELI